MENKVIFLVENNPRDEALTIRPLSKSHIVNEVIVAHDGVEALDYLFGTGTYAGRDTRVMPQCILLDLKLPKVNGLQVLQQIRADERTRRIPIVVFTCSSEEEDLINSYNLGANSYVRKPVDFAQFLEATRQLGLYLIVENQGARILIVDDHAVVRDGVKKILDEQHGEVAFGEACTTQEALKLAREENWDAVVLDIYLGGRNGLEVLKELKQIRPKLPVLILSMHSEEQYARRAFKAGAAGYITKDSSRTELVKAINKVIEGGRYVSPTLAENLAFDIERGTDQCTNLFLIVSSR